MALRAWRWGGNLEESVSASKICRDGDGVFVGCEGETEGELDLGIDGNEEDPDPKPDPEPDVPDTESSDF